MKRFWTRAEPSAVPGGYIILLDGKPLHPAGGALILPFHLLATAVAAEWQTAAQIFTPDDLPLTRLVSTALHRIPAHRANIIAQIAAYGANDLLCYRAEVQSDLAAWQGEVWQRWLDWAERELGVRFTTTNGVAPIPQPPGVTETFHTRLAAMTDYGLAGLGVIVPALGSLVLGLAVAAGALPPENACELAHLEELAQERRWGADPERLAQREKISADVAVTARFMVLCAP